MELNDVLRLVRKNIQNLAPYSTARDEYKGALGVFLDANENPFENRYNRYPDPRQLDLVKGAVPVFRNDNLGDTLGGRFLLVIFVTWQPTSTMLSFARCSLVPTIRCL